eukprot:3234490-Pleurochrysis_carterae.AAC.8
MSYKPVLQTEGRRHLLSSLARVSTCTALRVAVHSCSPKRELVQRSPFWVGDWATWSRVKDTNIAAADLIATTTIWRRRQRSRQSTILLR